MDFMATVLDVLGMERPASQSHWAFDGLSVMPILRGEAPQPRGIGWMYMSADADTKHGYAYRYGPWKLAVGGVSCEPAKASFDCSKPQLYNLEEDLSESYDLADKRPDILAAILHNFSIWHASVLDSMANESLCAGPQPPGPVPFPSNPNASAACTFTPGMAQHASDMVKGHVASVEECCGACLATAGCHASDYSAGSAMRPTWDGQTTGGTCHLKNVDSARKGSPAQTSCVPKS